MRFIFEFAVNVVEKDDCIVEVVVLFFEVEDSHCFFEVYAYFVDEEYYVECCLLRTISNTVTILKILFFDSVRHEENGEASRIRVVPQLLDVTTVIDIDLIVLVIAHKVDDLRKW